MECDICLSFRRKIYDYGQFYIATAAHPASEGHIQVVYRRHAPFASMSAEEFAIAAKLTKIGCSAVKKTFKADGTKIIIENGKMQPLRLFDLYIVNGVPFELKGIHEDGRHMHIDIIPCYNDVSRYNEGRAGLGMRKDREIAKRLREAIMS